MRKEARDYYDQKLAALEDSSVRLFSRNIPSDISTLKKIHLSGVCGKAMAPLAVLLASKGFSLSGSDEDIYPPMSDVVVALGIDFKKGFSGDNLIGADAVVIGSAYMRMILENSHDSDREKQVRQFTRECVKSIE